MAIIKDDSDSIVGVITFEDVLESLFKDEIYDELDP